ncbi:type VI secretion system-associated protein TagF [Diaphorobacter aerolatus]|uniref:Type VI secretion system-associated protein TagF n=1 Tax=Diaphorobacter aerolatus TaxID=1288495 RepID=A0A7H0GLB4_9BURK|nr:type VI secretion system-associated protein TagF [Diaphorobacter aerolatus]QNP49080.1 type VI secretion system-associated protein TagF [Diaphorobacter aerolatus]
MFNTNDLSKVEIIWGGKLPSHGDFLWSNPRTAVRARFEDWLQAGMMQGRSQFGDSWRDSMAGSAVWNFLVPFNPMNMPYVVAGSLAPSVDRVGRQYPFVVGYVFQREDLLRSTELVMELPMLLHLTGQQLHIAIRRAWPRATLDSIWANVLTQWRQGWAPASQAYSNPMTGSGSDILDVLGASGTGGPCESDMNTRPATRESAFPWPDIMPSLHSANSPSFWWTHPAGGAQLKALAYESALDGQLLTWLFGRATR